MDHKNISDTWERGDPYEVYIGRWSRQVAPLFLTWIHCTAGLRWLDMGCGTGALCAAIADHCSPGQVVGIEPSRGFLQAARKNLVGQAVLLQGDATGIALEASSVDMVVSGLVLNFISEPRAALIEMARVTRPGGTIGAYVWDYAGKMELLRIFWDSALELDPGAARLDEGVRFPVCNPEALAALFNNVGFHGVEVTAIDTQTPFASFDDYWQPFLGGQGPAPAYVMALEENARKRLRDRLRERLRERLQERLQNRLRERLPVRTDGAITLVARAWAVRAIVPK